jgi:hypothetical protein
MRLWNQIKQWATFSENEKVQMDRRAFMRGMVVTGAGLLVPGATVFDFGSRIVKPERVIPDIKQKLISDYFSSPEGRHKLAVSMIEPIRRRLDYNAIARKTFIVESLPEGALPLFGAKDA